MSRLDPGNLQPELMIKANKLTLTFVEWLRANTRHLEAWMLWNFDLLILIIGSWHPEG